MTLILFALLFGPGMSQGTAAPERQVKTLDICELTTTLAEYDGKRVAVRGVFNSGPHGAAVARQRCKSASPYKDFGTGLAVSLAFPGEEVNRDAGASTDVDRESLSRLEGVVAQAKKKREHEVEPSVIATFVGILHVRSGFKLWRTPNGGYAGNGFGTLGMYPAELVLQRVEGPTIATRTMDQR